MERISKNGDEFTFTNGRCSSSLQIEITTRAHVLKGSMRVRLQACYSEMFSHINLFILSMRKIVCLT